MEAAIESAAQQTAQDLHLLLDQARPSHPPAGSHPDPLGKENMVTPAAEPGKKSSRSALSATQPSTSSAQGNASTHLQWFFHLMLHAS